MFHNIKCASLSGLVAASILVANNAFAAALPTSGLVLGLDASQGVTTTAGVVTGWVGDTSTSSSFQWVSSTQGSPTLTTTFQTPNGSHAAIVFNGSSGLSLNTNSAALSLQNLSIFVVGSLTPASSNHFSDEFITNFNNSGWADGINDPGQGPANSPKFYTTAGDSISNSTGAGVNLTPGSGANNAYLLIDSIQATGSPNKSVTALNGLFLANSQSVSDTAPAIPYNNGEYPAIGYLSNFFPGQALTGDIAEILVYDNSAAGFNAGAVEAYLEAEFFTPEPSSVLSGLSLFAMGAIGLLIKRRRRA